MIEEHHVTLSSLVVTYSCLIFLFLSANVCRISVHVISSHCTHDDSTDMHANVSEEDCSGLEEGEGHSTRGSCLPMIRSVLGYSIHGSNSSSATWN